MARGGGGGLEAQSGGRSDPGMENKALTVTQKLDCQSDKITEPNWHRAETVKMRIEFEVGKL